jgi:hypothetical protein
MIGMKPDHLEEHRVLTLERMEARKLSVLELKREARIRHEKMLDPANVADREMLMIELEVADGMVRELTPRQTPKQLLAELSMNDPKREILEHQMSLPTLKDALAAAEAHLGSKPDDPAALQAVIDAEAALLPPFARRMQQARTLRTESEMLVQRIDRAFEEPERQRLLAERDEKIRQVSFLDRGLTPPDPKAEQAEFEAELHDKFTS